MPAAAPPAKVPIPPPADRCRHAGLDSRGVRLGEATFGLYLPIDAVTHVGFEPDATCTRTRAKSKSIITHACTLRATSAPARLLAAAAREHCSFARHRFIRAHQTPTESQHLHAGPLRRTGVRRTRGATRHLCAIAPVESGGGQFGDLMKQRNMWQRCASSWWSPVEAGCRRDCSTRASPCS